MIDTLKNIVVKTTTILDTVKTSSASSLDLITRVDTFYNNAWTKLVIFFSIVGIGVPFYIKRLQDKQLTLSEERLKKENLEDIEKAVQNLKSEIKIEYTNTLEELKEEIAEQTKISLKTLHDTIHERLIKIQVNQNAAMQSTTYALQARVEELSGNKEFAIYLFLASTTITITVENGFDLAQKFFRSIKPILLQSSQSKINDEFKRHNVTFKSMIESLIDADKKNELQTDIDYIMKLYEELKES